MSTRSINTIEDESCYNPMTKDLMSILIAEDNEAQRHYLSELLTNKFPEHAPVIEAADGESAVRMAVESRPALSILDIQMPKVSGVKAARSVWKEFPEARIIF